MKQKRIQRAFEKQLFRQWMYSDNVIKRNVNGVSFWASQDAMYCNRLYTIQNALEYYNREFINV